MSDKENDKEINRKKEEDETDNAGVEEVKSRAIVKYSVPKPAQFVKLQCNTDLNLPPANWLSSSADSYGLQRVTPTQKGFSSFRMAQMYPDCVGDVDVVSDAENIKKLLKLPYAKESISMMVHRIENTLLIDNFDIYKHFSPQNQNSDWIWLEKFITEHVGHKAFQADRHLYIKDRKRETLKQKSLVSKFLYHSLVVNQNDRMLDNDGSQAHSSRSVEYPLLPNPSPGVAAPDSDSFNHKYNRNVVWTFEDIEMLLGTDMPIFGEGTYPCISLRLRDMTTPINILTGIDYWLDNLMSNVPEVVMCYHLNGIVQKYELIKTEDIPRLDNSRFSPKVIRDVAQNILSFLKVNATKAGHTYWLFKGKDEEVIKLYDLTCLVPQDEKLQNPFTIPVAMLLYRVARSFMKSNEKRPPATIRMLLKNCLKLLVEEKYPEIVTSSHFMMSEVYVPVGTNPEAPNFEQDEGDNDSVYEDDEDIIPDDPEAAIKYLDLEATKADKFFNHYKPPPPITGTVEERCLQAVFHITKGLSCLKYFSEETKVVLQEDPVPMAKPSEPIPMGYSKLDDKKEEKAECSEKGECSKKGKKPRDKKKKTDKSLDSSSELMEKENALLVKNNQETQPLPTWKKKNIRKDGISWKDHLKILLYEKALLVYATLSEHHYVNGNYGNSIRSIGLLARCSLVMNKLRATSQLRENCLLGRAGDCCVMMVQHWNNLELYRRQMLTHNMEDLLMLQQLENDERLYDIHIGDHNVKCVFIYDILSIEQMILQGVQCYEEALKVSETESILRRLGNSLNETGMYFLNLAKNGKDKKDLMDTARKAEMYLARGLEVFEKVKDEANIALLYTNIGHMHRLLGYAWTPETREELTQREKFHFNKSFLNYKKALQVLGNRQCNPGIWDSVTWELSTAMFNMATIMHEHPPANIPLAEKEVLEMLQKALNHCDLDENNPKFPLYQYRAALIHYRMASLYHRHVLSTPEDASSKKKTISLAKIHYEKASSYYLLAHDVINYFTSQMQKFGLLESLAESAGNPNAKIKHFQGCLDIVLEIAEMVDMLVLKKVDMPEEGKMNCECEKDISEIRTYNTIFSLLKLVKQRLQHILKNLLKLCSAKNPPNKDCPKLAENYRECYKCTFVLKDDLTQHELLLMLNDVLKKIKQIVLKQ
ncbi:hypothetical protein HHI36_017846 [Cryptolaemus montrouzieri]|uniref:Erythroid differentiation-related factor 1 n=1 Tax=Cryptolaemus montrouzieri TaxID=559131 RepID=A0ABD2NNT1_9CUCU